MSGASSAPSFIGHGVGLRVPHYRRHLTEDMDVDWVEAITENFFGGGGRPRAVLEAVRRQIPIVFHGVSMGIASPQRPRDDYLARVRRLADDFEAPWISDHLCWNRMHAHHAHDLLPVPYTEEALAHVVDQVSFAQDRLGRRIALENVSSYVAYRTSEMTEWAFLAEVARRTDCGILLDINNVIVSARNHDFEPIDFIRGMPTDHLWQLHLANHDDRGRYKFDSHRGAVPDEAWALYQETLRIHGPISSLVEWDEDVPDWETLRGEQREAARRAREVLGS